MRYVGIVLLLGVVTAACQDDGATDQQVELADLQQIESSIDELETQIDDLREEGVEPVGLEGQEVTVNGAVEQILGDDALTVTGDDFWQFLDFEPSVLVSVSEEVPAVVEEGDVVRITGTVQTYTEVEFEDEYGLDLDEEIVVEYENELALAEAQVEPIG